jgi:3-hydroxybutyryl-CoA dehydrogenase
MEDSVRDIAVVGAGVMGADIAALFAAGGRAVHLVARAGRSRESLDTRLSETFRALGKPGADKQLHVVSDAEDVPWPAVQLVVESVAENLDAKRAVFRRLAELSRPDSVLASNASAIPITQIGAGLTGRERMLNLHFFMPAHLVPLVEVVCGEATDLSIAQRVYDLMRSIGMRPVLVRQDLPGFLANRLQHALMREAWSLVARGVASAEDVDTAVRYGFGFRYVAAGPMLQKDLSGLAVHLDASSGIYPDLCNDDTPVSLLKDLVARGDIGVKSGRGLFEWTQEKIAAEQSRYRRALTRARAVLDEE